MCESILDCDVLPIFQTSLLIDSSKDRDDIVSPSAASKRWTNPGPRRIQ